MPSKVAFFTGHARTKNVRIEHLRAEEGPDDLVRSEMMRPYMRLADVVFKEEGLKSAVTAIPELPVEQRYVWRVLSAPKWGFGDFDVANVFIDRRTLSARDSPKVAGLLGHRPVQFCLFVKALIGAEAMEEMMTQALAVAKNVPDVT